MTTPIQGEWVEEGAQDQYVPEEEAFQEEVGIPVRVIDKPHERESPEFVGWYTVQIGQAGQVSGWPYCTQILQRRLRRYKAKFGPVQFGTGCTAVIFASKPDGLSNPNITAAFFNGWVVNASGQILPDYDGEKPVYAIAIGGVATISLFDESYGDYEVG